MNFFEGEIDNGEFVSTGGHRLPLPASTSGQPGGAVTYGIRPEHLIVDPAGVPSTVSIVEPTGSETQIMVDLGGQQVLAVVRERHELHPGDEIRLLPDADFAHLFDSEDGERI